MSVGAAHVPFPTESSILKRWGGTWGGGMQQSEAGEDSGKGARASQESHSEVWGQQ